MQATYKNRLASGFDFQGAYTYAHSLDTSSGNTNAVGLQNPLNLKWYRGNSDFDVRHLAVLSWSYDLPLATERNSQATRSGRSILLSAGGS